MKLLPSLFTVAIVLLSLASCKKEQPKVAMSIVKCTPTKFLIENVDTTSQIAPLIKNLGDHHFSISTQNIKAQTYFDQGLKLTYAFNHPEAHRSFMEVARLDPKAAMAYWGQAYALGPNINDQFPDDERKQKAWEAIEKAKNLSQDCTDKEKALINALYKRYSADLSVEVNLLNGYYMNAMAKVAERFNQDEDILTLYAASVMNTVPWNYWDKEGNPSPNIPEAKLALEKAMHSNPNHPGAHHYYIHMVELPKPDLGVPSAERLGALMPAAGHIVHMPSHIYIRVGRYNDAVKVNQEAILADEDYISQCYAQGIYPLAYYPHNIHFLWSAASLQGSSNIAIEAAKKTADKVPLGDMGELFFLQDFASTPLLAYTRFGKWNEILTTPYPGDQYKHYKLIYHYARGIAFLRKNNLKEAKEELDALDIMQKDESLKEVIATADNSTYTMSKIAYQIVAGEIASAEGNYTEAIEHLKSAVLLEDGLSYTEPSSWHIPTRHTLGDILLKAKKFKEAEIVYLQDLEKLPDNGWSLIGLYKSQLGQNKVSEAGKTKEKFDTSWQHSDVKIHSSVL